MSLRALTAVWENSKAMGTLLLLELAIADNANDSGLAWPGIDYLARKSRMGRRTVIRLLHELEDTGEILVQRNQGPKGTNLYILPIVTRGATLALVVPPAAPPEGVPPAAPLVSPVALPVPPAAPVPQGGVPMALLSWHPNRQEPRQQQQGGMRSSGPPKNLCGSMLRNIPATWPRASRRSFPSAGRPATGAG